MPEIDVVLLVSRMLHIGAAILAIGGMAFARFVLHPVVHDKLSENDRTEFVTAIRARWARIVHVCIALLLITGGINFAILAIPPKVDPLPYHPIFGVKLLAALVIFFIASALVGRAEGFAKMRKRGPKWQNLSLTLAAIIIALSGVLAQIRFHQSAATSGEVTTDVRE